MPITLLLLVLMAQAAEPVAKPISVCDLLHNLGKYRAKEVMIRGYLGGDRHTGYFLMDNLEGKSCENMPRFSRTWPATVHMHWPGEVQTERAVEEVVTKRDREAREKKVLITVVGTVGIAKGPKIYRDLDGGHFGNAFGMNGQHPAQVVIKQVPAIVLQ